MEKCPPQLTPNMRVIATIHFFRQKVCTLLYRIYPRQTNFTQPLVTLSQVFAPLLESLKNIIIRTDAMRVCRHLKDGLIQLTKLAPHAQDPPEERAHGSRGHMEEREN